MSKTDGATGKDGGATGKDGGATGKDGDSPPVAPSSAQAAYQAHHAQRESSLATIQRTLDQVSFHDGVYHPAEALLSAHTVLFGETGLVEMVRSLPPASAADWLRLFGRSSSFSTRSRLDLVAWGLEHDSAEVRDAAILAVDNWADRSLVVLLREHHKDPVAWLRAYAKQVVESAATDEKRNPDQADRAIITTKDPDRANGLDRAGTAAEDFSTGERRKGTQ